MSAEERPQLSILLVAGSRKSLRKTLRYYRVQAGPRALEIVVAALAGSDVTEDWLRAAGFPCAKVVSVADASLARAEMAAVEAATAPKVVFAQAHAYPLAGFVKSILAANGCGDWTVIGPAMINANPGTAVSRAAMQINYGAWPESAERGPRTDGVPGHNSAYDRAALLSLGADIEKVLPAGHQLQVELAHRGHRIFYEPSARMEIVNVSRFAFFVTDLFRQGVLFAAQRRLGWSRLRRFAYATGAPLIPLVRLARINAQLTRAGRKLSVRSELPMVLCGLLAEAAGEFSGYLLGTPASAKSSKTAFRRLCYVRDEDRREDADESLWPNVCE